MRNTENEWVVSKAFSKQSSVFDELYDSNYLVNYSRKIIRKEVLRLLPGNGEILEINSGTGTDAVYFASHGFRITATDISPGMIEVIQNKVATLDLHHLVNARECSFWNLDELDDKKYDLVYSNFGGLNCTDDLDQVLDKLINKLKPGGKAVLVIMPVFCPWERIMLLFGNTRIAFRRKNRRSTKAHIEGEYFDVWYYNPSTVVKAMRGQAKLIRLQSLSLFVPPSAYRTFDKKYPGLLSLLERLDALFTRMWPFRNWGDYVILSFEKIAKVQHP